MKYKLMTLRMITIFMESVRNTFLFMLGHSYSSRCYNVSTQLYVYHDDKEWMGCPFRRSVHVHHNRLSLERAPRQVPFVRTDLQPILPIASWHHFRTLWASNLGSVLPGALQS